MRIVNLSIVTGCSILISFLGLAREIFTARLLGTGNNYDCFVAAFSLISFFLVLFNQQNIQSLYLPDYHRTRLQDENLSYQLKIHFGSYLVGVTTLIAFILYFFAGNIIHVIFPSFSKDKMSLTADLLKLMMPVIILNATLGIFHSHFHSRNKFLYPAIGQLINSALIIILMFCGQLNVYWLAKIYLISMGACWMFTALPLFKNTLSWKGTTKISSVKIVKNGIFILLISCIEQLLHLWFRSYFSSFGEGVLSEFSYAWKLIYFPVYLVGFSVSTAFFPTIVNEVSQNVTDKKNIRLSSQITLSLLILAASFLYFFAFEISTVLYGQEAMNIQSLHSISKLLQWFSLYIVITGMNIYLTRLAHLCKKSKPLFIGLACIIIVQILITPLLVKKYADFSIPLGATLCSTVFVLFQLFLLKKNNIHIMSITDWVWICVSCIGITAVLCYWLKPFSTSVSGLTTIGIACCFLTLGINAIRKNSFVGQIFSYF
ncbi:MAG: hypothetical protein K0M45_05910 [Candidatus Paracaedibacteraceae bacterium]|nr:hypothetical protein [Candidatus Paracaedibacteraceae bacterium]